MTAAHKLTEEEITSIDSEIEKVNLKLERQEIDREAALAYAKAQMENFKVGYIAHEASDLRKSVHKKVAEFIRQIANEEFQERRDAGLKFDADSLLDITAKAAVRNVSMLIAKMTMDGQNPVKPADVKYLPKREKERYEGYDDKKRFRTSDENIVQMELTKLNDYGTYISTEHAALKELRQKYDKKTFENYSEFAKTQNRNPARDAGILSKMKSAFEAGRYSHLDAAQVQAVMNILEHKIPQSEV
jgi:hypothetical protein